MRWRVAPRCCFPGVVVAVVALSGFVDVASAQFGNDDVSDLIYGGDNAPASPQGRAAQGELVAPKAEKGALVGLSQDARTERMRACFAVTRTHMEARSSEVDAAINGLMAQASGQATAQGEKASLNAEVGEEQASNFLVFNMALDCYRTADNESVAQHIAGGSMAADKVKAFFKAAQQEAPRPTKAQYILLEKVMNEEQMRVSAAAVEQPPAPNLSIRGLSAGTQVLYFLAIAGGLVGGGYVLHRRIFKDHKGMRERTAKATRKVARAQVVLDKKKVG